MKTFVFFLSFFMVFFFSVPISAENQPTFIIDAGHGGTDGGAVGLDGTLEKDLNLDLSLKLAELFYLADTDFILTRSFDDDTDGDPSSFSKRADILSRAALAAKYPSAVFVMIHMNSSTGKNDKGFQVFYGHKAAASETVANNIHTAVESSCLANRMREVKKAPSSVYLTEHVENTAVLVECGFISNEDDLRLLREPLYRQKLALVLFSALLEG